MKNCLTNLFKSSIFRYAKRIAIVCVFLSISVAAAGHGGPHTFNVVVQSNPANGAGSVYIAANNGATSGSSSLSLTCDNSNNANDDLSCYLFAKPYSGWAFSNWTLSDSKGALESSNSSPCKYTINVNTNNGGTETATANFKPIISINDPTNWVNEYNLEVKKDAKVGSVFLYLNNATGFSIIESEDVNNRISFQLLDANQVVVNQPYNITDGTYQLKITLAEDVGAIDKATYTITSTNNDGRATLNVSVDAEETKVTFRSNAYLSYQAGYTAGGGITVSNGSGEKTESLNSKDLTLKVMGTTGSNRFYRWKITRAGKYLEPEYIYNYLENSSDYSALYNAQNGDTVTVEHIGTAYARFRVDGATSMYYDNLQVALNAAKSVDKKIVYVHTSGKVLPDTYTVPPGVTLLVPGDAAGTYRTEGLDKADFVNNSTSSSNPNNCKEYRYISLDDNTVINVNGNVCVYANLCYGQQFLGMPYSFGRITMGNNCVMYLESGSKLHVSGFIAETNPKTSKIIAKSGSKVYETLQIRDWSGGTLAYKVGVTNKSKKVFVVSQYYVQNIETTLRIENGAEEYLTSGVEISSSVLAKTQPFVVTMPNDEYNPDDINGFVRLGTNAIVEKYYDKNNDRLHINISGSKKTIADAELGNMSFSISSSITALNSKEFVLPLNMNISVSLDSVNLTNLYPVAMLAESELTISETSSLILKGDLIVYDFALHPHINTQGTTGNVWGFHRSTSGRSDQLAPVILRSYGSGKTVTNKTMRNDAKLDVNGIVRTTSTGTLYTTIKYQDEANNTTVGITEASNIGAVITSSKGNGKVILEETNFEGLNTVTYQCKYIDKNNVNFIPISISSAKLLNGNGEYVLTDKPTTYTYTLPDPDDITTGAWKTPENIAYSNMEPVSRTIAFEYKVPNESTPETKSATITINFTGSSNDIQFGVEEKSINGITLDLEEFNYVIADDGKSSKLIVPVSYTQTNKYRENSATFQITTNKEGLSIPTFTVNVSEDYQPDFSCEVSGNLTKQLCKANPTANLKITPGNGGDNVTALLQTNNNLVWSYEIVGNNKDDFDFTFGGATDLSGAQITFKPTSAGTKTATLKITATSNFVATGQDALFETVEVPLSGTATLCSQPIELHEITQLFVGEEIDELISHPGNGGPIDIKILKGEDCISLSSENSQTQYSLKALKEGEVIIQASQKETSTHEGSEMTISFTILSAVTWTWDVLYYGGVHTNPLIVHESIRDGVLTIAGDNSNDIKDLLALTETNGEYTLTVGDTPISENSKVKFIFISEQENIYLEFFSLLSDLRLLTACVDSEARYSALNLEEDGASYFDGVVTFQSKSDATSSWTMQFYGTPSKVTFTPSGENLWQVLEGANANNMTPVAHANLTKYPAETEVTLQLNPNTRFVKFVYGSDFDDSNNEGTLAGICVHKLTIESNESVVYLPVGMTKEVVVKHSASTKLVPNSSNADLSCSASNPVSKNGYYETILTLSATAAGNYTLSAAENEVVTTIQVIAFDPMGLPIKTDEWKDNTDKADYYHFYVEESQNAHWWNDLTNPYIVFENTGSRYIARSVTFAFEGAPSVIKFNYDKYVASNEWTVEEYNIKTQKWSAAVGVRTTNDTYFEQELQHTTRKVRLSHKGEFYTESKVSNLIIEGYPKAIINPTELLLTNDEMSKSKTFTITAINLANIKLQVDNPNFTLQYQYIDQQGQPVFSSPTTDPISLRAQDNIYPDALGVNKMGDIVVQVTWVGTASVDQGLVTITNLDGEKILGTVKLVGSREFIEYTDDNKGNTGIWTGVPDGVADGRPTGPKYTLRGSFDPYTYHQVNVRNAFDENKNALFDYLVIYGETTTTTVGDYTIYEADRSRGSNACTPYYVYMRDNDGDGVGDGKRYIYIQLIENANSSTKGWLIDGDDALVVPDNGAVSVYVTGFCPYATTGSTKDDEGVLYFRGPAGSRVDVYLEDCHIYSRNKSITGQKYGKNDAEAPEFTYDVVQGSGAVLVFENTIADLNNPPAGTFDVAIHTIGHNILKSNYGAYNNPFGIASNIKIAQVSATVQVRLGERNHYEVAKTVLDFDDKWPTSPTRNDKGEYTSTYRTNGFLSLQKQANHAPSIDLGNANTVVNFRGGRVELQNAEIVSPNYKTTLAISHRTGIMGNIKDFSFPYGLGTDDVGGTVNFYDGTTTVIPMEIDPAYRDFYLMDEDKPTRTSCLRTPANTFIYGGSHCMLRACKYVTSRGGAPTDGAGNFLGLYKYPSASWSETIDGKTVTHKGGWTEINGGNGRVTIPSGNLPNANYGTESITPNTNNTSNNTSDDYLNFWVPEGYDNNVVIEVDKLIRTWLACMTEIQGGLLGVNARVGGDEYIGEDDEIHNLLYCQLDDYIYGVISASDGVTSSGDPIYTYSAPAINPTSSSDNPSYETVPLTSVSDYKQHNVISESDYEVTKKVYYVTTAKTDTWMNFTMPFDVEKIWMLEPYREADINAKFYEFKAEDEALEKEGKLDKKSPNYLSPMERTLMWQAKHNADFAAFFGMAMAIGQHGKDFNDIYNDYYTWAKDHADAGKYTGDDYDLRGLYELKHYNGSNFTESHYFLYKNMGDWTLNEDEKVAVARWEVAPAVGADGILMNKGETYSMLFPYCTGCDVEYEQTSTGEWKLVVDGDGLPKIVERDYWDYWSGKLLIFESTNGDPDPNTQDDNRPHTIKGSNYIAPSKVDSDTPWIFDGLMMSDENYDAAVLTGNSTFSTMSVEDYEEVRDYIFTYDDTPYVETFLPAVPDEFGKTIYESLNPTESFLVAHYHKPVKLITRNGRVVTEGSEDQGDDNSGTTTGGHMPTVGGGHSMFITGVDGGINVAVATPQQVRVISATGTILYSGYVNDNVDIPLPINGIYIVKGEAEVQKIFY